MKQLDLKLNQKPVFAEFVIDIKADRKTIYRNLVKQVSEYIVSNGYLPKELRRCEDDLISFKLALYPFRPSDLDTPLKDLK